MPQSVWDADAMCTIDANDPATNFRGGFDLGFFYAGATKAFRRRVIIGFTLGAAPREGRTLAPTDTVTAAALTLVATVVVGPAGWGAAAARLARADWDDAGATWNEYRAGAAWTAAGGDVATPPDDVAFTSPGSLGAFTVEGMAAHVADAMANRGGLLLVRLRADVESDAGGVSTYISGGDLGGPWAPRLTVTYASAEAGPVARDGSGTGRAAARVVAPSAVGRPARGVRGARPAPPSTTVRET